MYLANLGFVLGALAVLGACGWWAVAPFRARFAYPVAQAPLAGMILAPVATLGVMVGLSVRLRWAAAAVVVALAAGSLTAAWLGRRAAGGGWRLALPAALVAGAASVRFLTPTDLFFGSPGLLYAHGTDHLGYAHIADWLQGPIRNVTTTPAPDDWYGSWPQIMFSGDPRFGSFGFLALVSLFSGRSGTFAYDLGCAVVLAASSLGVAAVFASRPMTFAVLAGGLFTSFWFDWSRTGYLGKITAYPAIILVAGLLFAWMERTRRDGPGPLFPLAAIAALTAGASILFPGIVIALFVALLGTTFLVVSALRPEEPAPAADRRRTGDLLVAIALLVALAFLTSGLLARPLFLVGRTPLPWTWSEVLLRATEVEGFFLGRTGLPAAVVSALPSALLVASAGLAALAALTRVPAAAATLIAPLVLLGALGAADLRWQAMNFIGLYGPLLLGGTAALADALARRRPRSWMAAGVLVVLVAAVASHLPRFWATAAFHGGAGTPAVHRFSARETEALAAAIRREGGSALVDTGGGPHFAIFLLVELGRRGIPLQWTEQAWKPILGYRPWPAPTYSTRAPLRIVTRTAEGAPAGGESVLRTTQYELLRQP
jgi:hypothetical protein